MPKKAIIIGIIIVAAMLLAGIALQKEKAPDNASGAAAGSTLPAGTDNGRNASENAAY